MNPTGTHGAGEGMRRRATDRPTPPPRPSAAPCGGDGTPFWDNDSGSSARAQRMDEARKDNSYRLQMILADAAIAVLLALAVLVGILEMGK